MIGLTYGWLTVLERAPSGKAGHARVLCQCACGRLKEVISSNLRLGRTTSCGCSTKKRTHGDYGSLTHRSWRAMIQRTRNPRAANYKHYGALGVAVQEDWKDYATFLADMGPRPSKAHTLDRIDPTKGYFKDNCRWADWPTQANNKRINQTRS